MLDKPNYHGFLYNVAPSMDKVLFEFRRQEAREDVANHWFGQAMSLLFKEIKKFYKPISKLSGIDVGNLTTLPLIGGVVAGSVSFFQGLAWYWIILVLIGATCLLLAVTIPLYLGRMLDLNHPYFHLPAYKKFRQTEFDLLNHSIHDKQISYKGLADYVNGLLTKQQDELEIVKEITSQFNMEKGILREEIKGLREKEESAISTYRELIEELEEEIRDSETVIEYLVQLFHELYIIFHRIGRGQCGYSDLKLIAGYTLYKKEGDQLKLIADEGTTGQNPNIIHLNRGYHNPWVESIVEAATKQNNLYRGEPKEGYHVVSYRMNIGYGSNDVWVISLQITPSVNKRGYLLTLTDDIIDQRVIFNMLHGLCQIINNSQQTLRKKGDESYG